MERVVFINGLSQNVTDIFKQTAPAGFEICCISSELSDAQKIEYIQNAQYLVLHPASLPGQLLQQAQPVRLIQLLSAGYDKVDISTASEMGIPVATNGGANAVAVAEHAIALMLALYKKLLPCDASVRQGSWRQPINGFNTFELTGKCVGIIGAGNIGQQVAKRLKAGFDTEILYHDVGAVPELDAINARHVSLDELLSKADIISLHAPLLPATRGLLGEKAFALMKSSAVLINTSRAELIEETAFIQALTHRQIAGAGIDVFYQEPAPKDAPLTTLDNVILTPHSAGHSHEGWFRRSSIAWENIVAVQQGLLPKHMVNGDVFN